jgi:H+/Na+-translocating ferredoxin:NAD+ oxidoreductase subunit B
VLTSLLIAVVFMVSLGLLLAAVIVLANRRLFVDEDPRIAIVEEMLPHANCGACGTAGCRAFAEKLVQGELLPSKCTVNTKSMNQAIANYLGVELGVQEKRVAMLACAGGNNVARVRAAYSGVETCRAAALVSGGGKGCVWGCLGLGDCAEVCDFHAITLDTHGLPVVDASKCTACGDCVEICPRNLFSLHPISHRLWVACMSEEQGEQAEAECEVICTACGRCVVDSPPGLISIENNLAVIDYTRNELASPHAIERCPTGAIVWLKDDMTVCKGKEAKKITRQNALPMS